MELTGAVSVPFMMKWDRSYLKMARKAGIGMKLFERYMDDFNQAAIVPPPGSQYDNL